MAGTQAKTAKAQGAPAAAGSPPVKAAARAVRSEGAQNSGMPIDDSLKADIFAELGGKPDPVKRDTEDAEEAAEEAAESPESGAPEAAAEEENATDEGAETDQEETSGEDTDAEETEGDEDATAEGDEPAAEESDAAEAKAQGKGVTPGLEKRFAELTAKIGERDRKISELEQRLNGSAAPAPVTRAPQGAEAEIMQAETPADLIALRQKFEELEDLATANPDGYEIAGKKEGDEPTVYSKEQMAQLRVNARKALRMIPQREQQLHAASNYEAVAHTFYPEFNNPDSDEAKGAAYMVRTVPEIRRLPYWKQLVGDAIVGERLRMEKLEATRKAANGKNGKPLAGKPVTPAVRRPPSSVPGTPHRAPSAPTGREQKLKHARERATKTGSEADVANLLELSLSR